MYKVVYMISLIALMFMGCQNEKRVNKDNAPACNSEKNIVLYKTLQDKYDQASGMMQRARIEGEYLGLIGNQCQTFTKGMSVKLLETKVSETKLNISLIETPDKKTYWVYSSDLE